MGGLMQTLVEMSRSCRVLLALVVGSLAGGCERNGGSDARIGGDGSMAVDGDRPGSTESFLSSVAVTETGWVAVGGRSPGGDLVLTSSDGSRWDRVDIPKLSVHGGALFDVAFGNRIVVAVGFGSNSQVATRSPDGMWQVQFFGTNNTNVLFGNGVFLSTANVEPGARVSTNGAVWTVAYAAAAWFEFAGGRFVSYGDYAQPPGFRTSTDGVSWSDPSAASAPLFAMTSLAEVGDQLLGFGYRDCGAAPLSCSFVQLLGPRGTEPRMLNITSLPWKMSFSPFAHASSAIASDGVRVVVVSSSAIHSTSLPVGSAAWSDVDVAAQGWSLLDVSYRSGLFVAVGTSGRRALVVTSLDGVDWKQASLP
jgi:hypothetical protein